MSSTWIEWKGGSNPAGDQVVEVKYRTGEIEVRDARRFQWDHWPSGGWNNRWDIVAYRAVLA